MVANALGSAMPLKWSRAGIPAMAPWHCRCAIASRTWIEMSIGGDVDGSSTLSVRGAVQGRGAEPQPM
jgi:hypothetical protein